MRQLTKGLAEGGLRGIPGNCGEAGLKQQVLGMMRAQGLQGRQGAVVGEGCLMQEGGSTPGSQHGCRRGSTQRQGVQCKVLGLGGCSQ